MRRRAVVAGIACAAITLGASSTGLASVSPGGLRLGGFGGMALAEQKDVDDTLDDLGDFWSQWDVEWSDEELEEGLFAGGYAEYAISESWILGAEFLWLSSSGGYEWYVGDPFGSTDVGADYSAVGNVVSVYCAYRVPLGGSPAALRLGAGVGYILGAAFEMDFKAQQELQMPLCTRADTTVIWDTNLKATGSGAAFHALFGVEYEVAGNLVVVADVAYRGASVDELEVDEIATTLNGVPDDTLWDIEEGEILRWCTEDGAYFSTDEGDRVGLDFSGVYLTLRVAYAF